MNLTPSSACVIFLLLTGCQSDPETPLISSGKIEDDRGTLMAREVPRLLSEYQAAGAGVGIIHDGVLVWTGCYGEQSAGVAASAQTVFNTASVAKTLTAETLLALAEKNLIALDDPIHTHVDHPDLGSDPRFRQLTPRLLLSHRAGLLNWPDQ